MLSLPSFRSTARCLSTIALCAPLACAATPTKAPSSCAATPAKAPSSCANTKAPSSCASTAEARPAPAERRQLPQDIRKRIEAASSQLTLCQDLSALPKLVSDCSLELLALGTAARVIAISNCGAHACDVENWLYTQGRAPLAAQSYGPSTWEVTPDHQYLIIGEFVYAEPDEEVPVPAPVGVQLRFTQLDTKQERLVPGCLSPRLSPSGKWLSCRTFDGSVARLPLPSDGGPQDLPSPEIVAQATLPPGTTLKLDGPFQDYPAPVEFLSPSMIRYSLYLSNEEVLTIDAPWQED